MGTVGTKMAFLRATVCKEAIYFNAEEGGSVFL
jgi:hypothetical protein